MSEEEEPDNIIQLLPPLSKRKVDDAIARQDIDRQVLEQEIIKLVGTQSVKDLCAVMILGSQLYSWANHYMTKLDASDDAVMSIVQSVQQSQMTEDGGPQPFMAEDLLKHMNATIPFIRKKIKKESKA